MVILILGMLELVYYLVPFLHTLLYLILPFFLFFILLGAHDDAGGIWHCWEAMRILKNNGLRKKDIEKKEMKRNSSIGFTNDDNLSQTIIW